VEETILTRLPEPHQALYKQLERNVIVELQSRTLTIPNAAARIMRLRQAALHPALLDAEYYDGQITGKLEALRDLVNEEIPSHEQVLVYSSFVDGCHLAADAVGRSTAVYAGGDSDPGVIRLFQEGGVRTLCATPGKGGVGLNLFNANYVVFLDTPWSTVQLRQARERVRKVGKTEPVGVYTLVARGTVDEYVVHHVLKKVDQIGEADVVRNVLDFYSGVRYN